MPTAPAPTPAGGGRQIAIGTAWMVGLRLLDRGIGILSTLVLARLLYPTDFGLVSLATGAAAMVELFLAFSLDVALIQHPAPTRDHYDSAWTLNLIFAATIAACLLAFGPQVSGFYGDPRVGELMRWLALGTLLEGLNNIRLIELRRQMLFQKEFLITATRRIVVFFVTIGFALALRNYWALVIGILTGKTVYLVMSYVMRPYLPRLTLVEKGGLIRFSRWLLVHNILSYAVARGGEISLGRYVSQTATGLFSLAHDLASLATVELVGPVNRASMPVYARLSDDLAQLRQTYLNVVGVTAIVVLPAAGILTANAGLLVPVLFGPAWAEAAPTIQVLCIYTSLLALQSNTGGVYTALGKSHVIATLSFMKTAALVPLLVVLVPRHGLAGAAWSYAISTALYTPYSFWVLHRTLDLNHRRFVGAIWRPMFAGLVAAFATLSVLQFLGMPSPGATLGTVAAGLAVSILLCAGTVLALWTLSGRPEGAEATVLKFMAATGRKALAHIGLKS